MGSDENCALTHNSIYRDVLKDALLEDRLGIPAGPKVGTAHFWKALAAFHTTSDENLALEMRKLRMPLLVSSVYS